MITLLAPLLLAIAAPAAPPAGTEAEPFLKRYLETRRFSAGRPARVTLTPEGDAAIFLRTPPRSPVAALLVTDVRSGETRELASAERLLAGDPAALTAEEQAQLERQRITTRGITAYEASRDGKRLAVAVGGKLFLLERASGAVTPLRPSGRPLDPRFSPDGRTLSYVVDHDVRLLDLATGVERALTTGGTEDVPHGLAEFAAQEELDRHSGYWWSPDSKLVAWQETDQRAVERFTIQDPLHPERPPGTFRYPRAGRANATVKLAVSPVTGGPPVWLDWDREKYPYLGAVRWTEGGPLSLVVLDRAQRELALLAADPATGATRVLLTEQDAAWVNLVQGYPLWKEDGSGFFWLSERTGWPEVELHRPDGSQAAVWVKGSAGLARLVGYDQRRRWLWFTGGPEPTQTRLYVVKDGAPPEEWLPPVVPVSTAAELSRNGEVLLVTRSTLSHAGVPAVYRTDGRRLVRPAVGRREAALRPQGRALQGRAGARLLRGGGPAALGPAGREAAGLPLRLRRAARAGGGRPPRSPGAVDCRPGVHPRGHRRPRHAPARARLGAGHPRRLRRPGARRPGDGARRPWARSSRSWTWTASASRAGRSAATSRRWR